MQNNLQNELSDEMLDAVVGGQEGEWVADAKCYQSIICR